MRIALTTALALSACGDNLERAQRILFIHGGSGTGGFVEGGADEHLSSIYDHSTALYNHGYGQLAELLEAEGYVLEQRDEGPITDNRSADLSDLEARNFSIVVFGSNNATYGDADAARVGAFVANGGGALFMSDGNWGTFWDKAPSSDQTFLSQFGLVMNQDGGGKLTLAGPDFLLPAHPILAGVDALEGEGVSPCTGADRTMATRLVVTHGVVKRNTAADGPVEDSSAADGALWVMEAGGGRVACHFDRNTFFKDNGAATSLSAVSNAAYARNLFNWLAGRI